MIWNEPKECMSRDELSHLQSVRLMKMVDRVYHSVPFYRKKMQELGLEPGDIRGLEDLQMLPFTTKDDLRDNYPLGLLAVPEEQINRIQASSGTTGKPTVSAYTRKDLSIWSECVARGLTMAGIGRKDRVHVSYGYGLFTGGLGLHDGASRLGATVIPMSSGNTKRQVMLMEDLGATVLACTPSYAMHLAEAVVDAGRVPYIKLKAAICGAEPWTDAMRDKLEEMLNIKAYDIYGLTEIIGPGVAQDCPYHKGLHIWEDHFIPEILDPQTLKPVEPGTQGELAITTVTKEAVPLLRYRTKDLTSITYDACDCGRTHARISRFTGRTDDMLIIRGVNVFPSQVEAALLEVDEVLPNYLMTVDRKGSLDTLEVQVEVEERYFSDEINQLQKLASKIEHVLKQALGIAATVKLVEPKTIERSEGKAKRAIDRRKL